MARPRTFDESDVLDRAVQAFWSHGFDGTSIADLEEATGLGRQSLYNAFGGKRELFVRALEHYYRRGRDGRAQLGGSGLEALDVFFSTTIDFMTETGARRGCFLTRARLESSDTEGVPAVCHSSEAAIRSYLRDRLEEARVAGEIRAGVTPDVAAGMLATWVQGLSAATAAGADADALRSEARLLIQGLRGEEVHRE